jgi:hypothetical protein
MTVYSAPAGEVIRGGRFAPSSLVAPTASGGTVIDLLAAWPGSGFRHLSTAPADSVWPVQGHSGSVWDEQRQIMWIWGADTHSGADDYPNAVYRWDVADGLFHRCGDNDPWPGQYRVGADGALYADAACTRPWAAHGYREMLYDAATREIMVMTDLGVHASAPAIQDGDVAFAARVKPLWRYSTASGTWRQERSAGFTSFAGGGTGLAVCHVPGYGYYRATGPNVHRLTEDLQTFSSSNQYGKTSNQYHNYSLVHGTRFIAFGGGAGYDILCSVHDVTALSGSYLEKFSDFPALVGYSRNVQWAVGLPDGRALFGVMASASPWDMAAMVYDPVARSVTDTGDRLTGFSAGPSAYAMWAEWSAARQCALFISDRFTGRPRVYGYRPGVLP